MSTKQQAGTNPRGAQKHKPSAGKIPPRKEIAKSHSFPNKDFRKVAKFQESKKYGGRDEERGFGKVNQSPDNKEFKSNRFTGSKEFGGRKFESKKEGGGRKSGVENRSQFGGGNLDEDGKQQLQGRNFEVKGMRGQFEGKKNFKGQKLEGKGQTAGSSGSKGPSREGGGDGEGRGEEGEMEKRTNGRSKYFGPGTGRYAPQPNKPKELPQIKSPSMAQIAGAVGKDPEETEFINLTGMGAEELPDMSSCKHLKKLDLSRNALSSLETLGNCRELNWLCFKENHISDISPLRRLFKLSVLTMGSNKVTSLEPLVKLSQMKALIANDNQITSTSGLAALHELNTLVLSHNMITEISGLKTLRNLKKLSIAHNNIRNIPDLSAHPYLEELRLNDNKIMKIPETMDRNPMLKTLDLGKNRLFSLQCVKNLSSCRKITNLNLFGNAKLLELESYKETVLLTLPELLILDGRPTDKNEGVKKRKQKQELRAQRAAERDEIRKMGGVKTDGDGPGSEEAANLEPEQKVEPAAKKAKVDLGPRGAKTDGKGKKVGKNPFEAFAQKQKTKPVAEEAEEGEAAPSSQGMKDMMGSEVSQKQSKLSGKEKPGKSVKSLGDGWESANAKATNELDSDEDDQELEGNIEAIIESRKSTKKSGAKQESSGLVTMKEFGLKAAGRKQKSSKKSSIQLDASVILVASQDHEFGGNNAWD